VLQAIPELSTESNANWNKRYRENLLRLKSGNLYEVARVIKSLTFRERERGLSTGERKMLHTAKQILISEIVLSEKTDYASVEQRLSCAMKSRQSPCKL
jgi:CarD family transcriptional regulator